MTCETRFEEILTSAGATVLRVNGRLDARSASTLTTRCAEIRAAGRHLVLNLAGVSFIASSGIGALLALVEDYRLARLQVRLAAISTPVESVLRLLNLEPFLHVDPSEEDATQALKAA
jgi:anti-anti-sigma factor